MSGLGQFGSELKHLSKTLIAIIQILDYLNGIVDCSIRIFHR